MNPEIILNMKVEASESTPNDMDMPKASVCKSKSFHIIQGESIKKLMKSEQKPALVKIILIPF
jgi:hypothetical protein